MNAEIIAPVGSMDKLTIALAFGAEAVYCGLPAFSLRARANDMTFEDLLEVRRQTKERGVHMYLTCNIFARREELERVREFAPKIREVGPDALIVSDPGMLYTLREELPEMKFHLSVQANTVNGGAVKFWWECGVKRVIVARELSLSEIRDIHAACPEMELECFVHGSICMAYSGRCLMSNYLADRDGNRGQCSHSCRWEWKVGKLTESTRPNEEFELEEDGHGSYLMSSRDMCLIEHLGELMEAGVTGFKIEGRHKTVGYLGTIVRAYRKAKDDAVSGKPFDERLLKEVYAVSNREYTQGFFDGTQKHLQHFERTKSENMQNFLGIVDEVEGTQIRFLPKNRFFVGEEVEVVTPGEVYAAKVLSITGEKGAVDVAHSGETAKVTVDIGIAVTAPALLRSRGEGKKECCGGGGCGGHGKEHAHEKKEGCCGGGKCGTAQE